MFETREHGLLERAHLPFLCGKGNVGNGIGI